MINAAIRIAIATPARIKSGPAKESMQRSVEPQPPSYTRTGKREPRLLTSSNSQYGFIGLIMTVRTELVEVRSSFDKLRTNDEIFKMRIIG